MTGYVVYKRVSTDRQGQSGLGLEGQEAAIQRFLEPADVVLAAYTEVESGGRDDRPELAKAIRKAKRTGSVLLVSTLDRLTRDEAFFHGLRKELGDKGVRFADNPNATPFELSIRAAMSQEERRKISERTRAALAAAKARGVILGGFRGVLPTDAMHKAGAAASAAVRGRKATQAAYGVAGIISEIQQSGTTSANGIAGALNERGVATPSGHGVWTAKAVQRVLARLEAVGGDD